MNMPTIMPTSKKQKRGADEEEGVSAGGAGGHDESSFAAADSSKSTSSKSSKKKKKKKKSDLSAVYAERKCKVQKAPMPRYVHEAVERCLQQIPYKRSSNPPDPVFVTVNHPKSASAGLQSRIAYERYLFLREAYLAP